jgi:hypothetical protein
MSTIKTLASGQQARTSPERCQQLECSFGSAMARTETTTRKPFFGNRERARSGSRPNIQTSLSEVCFRLVGYLVRNGQVLFIATGLAHIDPSQQGLLPQGPGTNDFRSFFKIFGKSLLLGRS